MSVPWNKSAYEYVNELEDTIIKLRVEIEKLNKQVERLIKERNNLDHFGMYMP
jgi:regulator of replication initiation timing